MPNLSFLLLPTLLACQQTNDAAPVQPATVPSGQPVVKVYSARHYDGDRELHATFTALTGIAVEVVEGSAQQLVARMQSEGAASQADVYVAADAGALWRAQEAGLLQPLVTEALAAAVPSEFRDPAGHWWGFQRRARVVAYDTSRVQPDEVLSYEALAAPRFKAKLCVRSSDNIYNLSLMGALLSVWGAEKSSEWARQIVANMARPPEGGDRDQIRAVGAGVCEVALTNSYYYIRMATSSDLAESAIADKVKLAFPSLDGKGTHVNISGVGLTAHAQRKDNAVRFIEFLVSPEAQTALSASNGEFTLSPQVPTPAPAAAWANFLAHPMPVVTFAARQSEAQRIMSEAGWR